MQRLRMENSYNLKCLCSRGTEEKQHMGCLFAIYHASNAQIYNYLMPGDQDTVKICPERQEKIMPFPFHAVRDQ